MIHSVLINGKKEELRDLIGQGGEAEVYRLAGGPPPHLWRAAKVYHTSLGPSVPRARVEKFAAFPRPAPAGVVTPLEVITDAKGVPLGFTMPLVSLAHDIRMLSDRRFRAGTHPNKRVIYTFKRIYEMVDSLHRDKVVVGDLNDGNVLISAGLEPYLIDIDSCQFGGHLCTVAHEKFVDPQLYGQDFTARACFTPETDWYAFSVLLFQSLLYVHPYGGVHPAHKTMLRRAESRVSALRLDVKLPKVADPIGILPDDLRDWFWEVFEKGVRGHFPPSTIGDIKWTTCSGCGLEYASARCPTCGIAPVRAPEPIVQRHGRCTATPIFATPGRILSAVVHGGKLRYLFTPDGEAVYRDFGVQIPWHDAVISGDMTWSLVAGAADSTRGAAHVPTGTLNGHPIIAANSHQAFSTHNGELSELNTGMRIGQVVEERSWIAVGEKMGVGFYRLPQSVRIFSWETSKPGVRDNVEAFPVAGKVIAARAFFDVDQALLRIIVQERADTMVHLLLISAQGKLLAGFHCPLGHGDPIAELENFALFNGRIIAATDEGLQLIKAGEVGRVFSRGDLFVDTKPYVSADSQILAGPGGTIYVVGPKSITQLALA
jgi:tRNA A-37 threonylcarbamoyl transferase component Bud32